jgi:branched-subunit amino acid ABC-type transport system permease component
MNASQLVVNSLVASAELGLIAIGLTMTFALLKFANFAHADAGVLGAYLTFALNVGARLNFAVSLALAALAMGLVGILIDRTVFRLMRDRRDVTPMITSLGLSLAIRSAVQAFWGPQPVSYNFPVRPGYMLLGARVTGSQLGILAVVVVAMLGFHALLHYTRVGKALRATAANPDLAQASGIDIERSIKLVWFIGTGFASVGLTLVAWDTQLDPYLGFNLIIPIFCVVLIGGVGSVYGAMLGALIVGFAENLGIAANLAPVVNVFGLLHVAQSVQLRVAYQPAIVYALVVALLLLKPSGLANRELA